MIDEGTVAGAVQALRANTWTKDVVEDLTDRELRWIVRVTLGAASSTEPEPVKRWTYRVDRTDDRLTADDEGDVYAKAQEAANRTGRVVFVYLDDDGRGWDRHDVVRPVANWVTVPAIESA